MIKVTLDFKNIETKKQLILYVGDVLNLSTKGINPNKLNPSWDSFRDHFEEIVWKEYDLKKLNKEDLQDIEYLKGLNRLGLKNEFGIRDDLEIKLINFYIFKNKYPKIATDFWETINEFKSLYNDCEIKEELLNISIIISS